MHRMITLFAAFVIASRAWASDPIKWEPVRPSVFLLMKTAATSPGTPDFESLAELIQEASRCLFKSEEPAIPDYIENILLVEEDTQWIVAFFQKGNGRVAATVDGQVHRDSMLHFNPDAVRISKATRRVEKCKAPVALPWPMTVSLGIQVRYSDPTLAEEVEAKSGTKGRDRR